MSCARESSSREAEAPREQGLEREDVLQAALGLRLKACSSCIGWLVRSVESVVWLVRSVESIGWLVGGLVGWLGQSIGQSADCLADV